ncbi:MAG: hypothetical protein KDA88_07925 [Planctomycetaceae bacterium]|nr:hypothetical protein [Planctomycetaceae bacterium]
MVRYIGLLMCGCLIAASAWLAGQTNAQDAGSESENPFARFRSQGGSPESAQPAPAASGNPFAQSTATAPSDANRLRVQDYMRQSRTAQKAGNTAEAVRLASLAARMSSSWGLTFAPSEQSPLQLLAELQGQPVQDNAATALAMGTNVPERNPQSPDEMRSYSQELLNAARADIQSGAFTAAESKVQKAMSLDATYSVLDLRPEHVMVELARAMPARPDGPSATLANLNTASPAAQPSADPFAAQATASANEKSPKERASELVAMAREALRQGHLTEARDLALEAKQADVTWSLLEDRPELVLTDIGRQNGTEIIAASNSTTAQPQMTAASAGSREQALALLKEARQLMSAGQFEQAKARAEQASQMDVTFTLFDDRPDLVLQEVQTAIARNGGTPNAFGPSAAMASNNAKPESAKAQAVRILNDARKAIQQGNFESATQLVAQAEQFDVAYDLLDETPERIREDLTRAIAARSTQPSDVAVASADNPFAGNQVMRADAVEGSASVTPSFPADASALELFNMGISELRQGHREGAYAAFLQAYNTGEKLDPYRQQQLQDKLRELRPRNRDIVQASNESYEPTLLPTPNGTADPATQDAAAKFDALRVQTLNALTRSDRLREKQPDEAIALIDQTLEAIAASELGEERTGALTASLNSTRSSIESYRRMKAPIFEQERRNAEVKAVIKRDIETRRKIEQDLAELVDKYNDLMDQSRFAEAHALALQAKELDRTNQAVIQMELTSLFAMRDDRIQRLKSDKEEGWFGQIMDVEEAAFANVGDANPLAFAENWTELKARRKALQTDARDVSEAEKRVRQSLLNPVSLHFDNSPLAEVMQYIADTQGINVVVDEAGLTEEGITASTTVAIAVDGIKLRSALNLMLSPLNLDYTVENEVLTITSKLRQQGELETAVYQVADLVIPVTAPSASAAFKHASAFNLGGSMAQHQQSIPAYPALAGSNGMMQVPANPLAAQIPTMGGQAPSFEGPAPSTAQFQALSDLITTTVAPSSWAESSGQGTINRHDSTLSLVVRQTQKVHQEIADLLDQLRRLQDVQVTVEVRYITVSEKFFEQIGIDFDFNVNDTVGGPYVDDDFNPIRPFGSTDPTNGAAGGGQGGAGQAGQGGGNNNGGQNGQQQTISSLAPFSAQPSLNRIGRDNWPGGTVVGLLNNTSTLSPELDIPFRQGSFDIAQPPFGGFDANAGIQFGMAILSDIEAFAFVRAAQGDRRSNVMLAPKLTLFNGQLGNVTSALQRPFVVSLSPVASTFNIGFQPQISVLNDGTSLTVRAVVSADRRYVRLMLLPNFTNITDVFTFSFISGGGGGGGGFGGQGGGGFGGQGGGGGFGGGGFGGGGGGGFGGGGQQGGQRGGGASGSVTVQQPVQNIVTVDTVVSVPDGGTVLLGGVKSLKEGRNMAGVPILNKIPYISRLFKNTGVGRETESLMLMVTPRIIIQEEEEQLLGL